MRVCSIKDVQPGMMLGKSLFSENGQLLLRAGFPFDREMIRIISDTGRKMVYVMEEGTDEIIPEDVISEETRSRATMAFTTTLSNVSNAVAERAAKPEHLKAVIERGREFKEVVDVVKVHSEISSIVDEIIESGCQVVNQTLIKSQKGYNQEHAIDVTLISLLIGRRLLYNRRDMLELGMGAFLHDLGKAAMPQINSKPASEHTEDDYFMMREHPVFGQLMLAGSTDRFFMAQSAILYHHERQDGLGYPLGVSGTNKKPYAEGADPKKSVYPFSEIIAVADAYDNFIAGRRAEPVTPEVAIRDIVKQARSVFNVEVVKLLSEVISIFPTGSMVKIMECSTKLLEGAVGAIMKPNQDRPHHPIIVLIQNSKGNKITPKTVDLSGETLVRLEMQT